FPSTTLFRSKQTMKNCWFNGSHRAILVARHSSVLNRCVVLINNRRRFAMSEESNIDGPPGEGPEINHKKQLTRRGLLGGAAGAAVATGVAATLWSQQPAPGPYDPANEAFNASKRVREAKTIVLEPSWTLVYRNGDVELVEGHSV